MVERAGRSLCAHEHGYDKVIVVESGSITFGLPDAGRSIGLAAGDRLELPAGTRHEAHVADAGVVCLEAHLPAGRLRTVAHRTAGSW